MIPEVLEIAIIGGGIAGLSAAEALARAGHRVRVFDKGRSPGSRASSRRLERGSVDHGAQYFTAREPTFRRRVDAWIERGTAARWNGRIVAWNGERFEPKASATERFVGVPRMSALAADGSSHVDVRSSTHVARCSFDGRRWELADDAGRSLGAFDRLLVTAPPAQAAALIGDESPLGRRAQAVRMQPCWAVWLTLSHPSRIPFDGAFVDASPLSWIARDSSKPRRGPDETWVLHATSGWSERHVDVARNTVADRLSAALERASGASLPPVVERGAHLWRYAMAAPPLDVAALVDSARGLALAGDWCHGSRVEGAWLSGRRAAQQLVSSLRDVDGC